MKYVIVGNSGAAISAIKAIRSADTKGEIVLISKEDCFAYSPMSITYYLSGKTSFENIFFTDRDFYQENDVETIFGKKVTKVRPDSKSVELGDGNSVSYDKLLLATGSSPRIPSIPGVDLPNIFSLYTASDARILYETAQRAETVAVVGAGLSGFHAIDPMAAQGKKVTVIETADQVLPTILDAESAAILSQRLLQNGVVLCMGETVAEIRLEDNKKVLKLTSGGQVAADMVIIAIGVKPNVDLVAGSGINVNHALVVNEYCQTNFEDIFAAGDVAEAIDPLTGNYCQNATWFNAIEQGHIAGMNLAGIKIPYQRNVRLNTFSLLGLPCASIGLMEAAGPDDEKITYGENGIFKKYVLREDTLLGAMLIGDIQGMGLLANLIRSQKPYPGLKWELRRGGVFSPYARGLSL